jgi:prephenate dehydratase
MIGSVQRVAFQGERGAFSEEAARKLLGESVTLVPCSTFEKLFAAVDEGRADSILAPIENSLAGSVQRTYDLLLASSLRIKAEAIIPIAHHLIGCPGSSVETITTVESHPVALAQCENFFKAQPQIKRVATDDTAASVRRVVEHGDPTRAAIGGSQAATLYGGVILREHLEDHEENYTRFVLLTPEAQLSQNGADKISLAIRLGHQPGALHAALAPFASREIDLLRIESRPIMGEPWQYRFYLDLRGSDNDPRVISALAELRQIVDEVRVFGCYAAAQK